jgi:hypothetical protein
MMILETIDLDEKAQDAGRSESVIYKMSADVKLHAQDRLLNHGDILYS